MIYDKIYVGSGPILMLDAINSSLLNEKVFIIDKSYKLGGAWKSIELFDGNEVENAVHYLLPNKKGYDFLKNTFKVDLAKCRNKFYAINFLKIKRIISVNNYLGKFIYTLNGGDQAEFFSWETIKKLIFNSSNSNNTKYPIKGINPIIKKIIKVLIDSGIDYKLNQEIKEINIKNNIVLIKTKNRNYQAKKLIISHGFIPPKKFFYNNKNIKIALKKHPRPSLHLICRAEKNKLLKNKFFRYSQVLFPKGNLIKYVHQLSQYQVGFEKNKQQLINVVALNHNLKKKISNFYLVSKKLEEYGLIPKSEKRSSEDFYWQDILIPQITTEDLNQITKKTENVVSFFSTECMNTAFGDYCENWNFPKGLFYIT